jgi:hypothetical protein
MHAAPVYSSDQIYEDPLGIGLAFDCINIVFRELGAGRDSHPAILKLGVAKHTLRDIESALASPVALARLGNNLLGALNYARGFRGLDRKFARVP